MGLIPPRPTDAFVNPPAAFPAPSTWQQRGCTGTTTSSPPSAWSSTPTATALFSGSPTAADISERKRTGDAVRFTPQTERRHRGLTSALGRPLYASSAGGDTGAPESSGERDGDEDKIDPAGDEPPPRMGDSEKLREKLETIAQTAAPIMDDVSSGGLTQDEQAALEELREDTRVEEELERLEARQKKSKSMDSYLFSGDDEEEEDPDAEKYEEIIANMTKPLGITIEESTDKARLVYITSVGEKAEAAGLRVGDVMTGASAVFGDAVWSVKDKTIEEIRSLVRCRTEPYSLLRVERGHVSLEERCAPGFDKEDLTNCWMLPDGLLGEDAEECELNPNYTNLWAAVYAEEMEVLHGESAKRAAGVGRTGMFSSGVGGGAQPKKGNQGPPPKDKPGPGSFNGETITGDSWDSSGTSF
eukprot:g10015.t1